jgi:oligoribonuclease (3'-5' exoribonuclease)
MGRTKRGSNHHQEQDYIERWKADFMKPPTAYLFSVDNNTCMPQSLELFAYQIIDVTSSHDELSKSHQPPKILNDVKPHRPRAIGDI